MICYLIQMLFPFIMFKLLCKERISSAAMDVPCIEPDVWLTRAESEALPVARVDFKENKCDLCFMYFLPKIYNYFANYLNDLTNTLWLGHDQFHHTEVSKLNDAVAVDRMKVPNLAADVVDLMTW